MGPTKPLAMKAIAVAAAALAADQALKAFARQSLALCSAPPIDSCDRLDLAGPLGLMRLENAGGAFGFLQGLWLLVAALGLLLIPLYGRRLRGAELTAALAVGFQVGGGLANLLDRLLYGGVTDYIDLGQGPIFNLADLALAVGMVLAVRAMLGTSRTPDVKMETRGVAGAESGKAADEEEGDPQRHYQPRPARAGPGQPFADSSPFHHAPPRPPAAAPHSVPGSIPRGGPTSSGSCLPFRGS